MPNNKRKAQQRFIDQPGQWVDDTPKSVKERQEKAWKEFQALNKAGKAYKQKKK